MGRGGEVQRPAAGLAGQSPDERRTRWAGRASIGGRKTMTYYPGTVGLPDAASPPMLNKSWTITADVEVPDDGAERHDRHAGRAQRRLRPLPARREADVRLQLPRPSIGPPSRRRSRCRRARYEARRRFRLRRRRHWARAGRITLTANGKKVAEGRLREDHPDPVLARRRARHRHGRRLAGGFHLQAAVPVHGQDREGDGRVEVTGRYRDWKSNSAPRATR